MGKAIHCDTKIKLTVLLEDSEGDHLCIACAHQFGIIRTSNQIEGADANYCPHCGAKVIHIHAIPEEASLEDFIEVTQE